MKLETVGLLQLAIGLWHIKTFGEDIDPNRIRGKFREEAREFLDTEAGSDKESDEIADCIIVLAAYAFRQGIDLEEAVTRKFERVVNRDQKARDDDRRERREASTI